MESFDLDINNYNLEELLNVFNLGVNFDKDSLIKARTFMHKTHPDKSGLTKEYFLFFRKAYNVISNLYHFKCKKSQQVVKQEYLVERDESKNILLKKFEGMKKNKFNDWFNEMFENTKVGDSNIDNGYGDWLKSENDMYKTKRVATNNFGEEFEKHKTKCKQLVKRKEIGDGVNNVGWSLEREEDIEDMDRICEMLLFPEEAFG